MAPSARSSLAFKVVPYLGAAFIVAVAAMARTFLDPIFGDRHIFLTFLVPVALSALYAGLRPTLFAIVLSYLAANYLFLPPRNSLTFNYNDAVEWVNLLAFLFASSVIVVSIQAVKRAQTRAEASAAQVASMLEEARQADRRKDQFLAMLAHELRHPLAPLSNALEIWSMEIATSPELDELRTIMERQATQLSRLVDDLTDVSRITRGNIRLRRERCDVRSLIDHAVEANQLLLDERGHQLHLDLPGEPLVIDGDPVRLTQVFGNILHNAAKYTDAGGTIRIIARRDGPDVIVRIRDNGPGIPEPMLTAIFEMFAQVDATLTRSHGGLGIGLTLVKQLVELHGGSVAASSEGAGKGSEFVVKLPIGPVQANFLQRALPAKRADRAPIPCHKILVVDDATESAKTLAKLLQNLGQEVAVVNDGFSAIESVKVQRPEIVFLDIAMPGMSGYEVAQQLQAQLETNSIVLIALTGYGQQEDRRRALQAGFHHHLTKPTSATALAQLLLTL